MANLIIPVDKCYSVYSTPVNKNVIQKVSYTEKNINLEEGYKLIEDKTLDYWTFENEKQAKENEKFELDKDFKLLSEETKTSTGTITLSFSTFPYTRTYDFTRTSKVVKYSIQYSLSNTVLGALLDTITVSQNGSKILYQSTGDLNEDSFTESFSNITGLDEKSEFDNYFDNLGYVSNSSCYYVEFDSKNKTYTIYIGLEKQVDYTMYLTGQTTKPSIADMIKHYYCNYVLYVNGDSYVDTDEDIEYIIPYGTTFKSNDNSYELNGTYLSRNNSIRCIVRESTSTYANLSLGDWGSKKVYDEYSKGKMVVNIEMPLLKLYNTNGDIGVDKEILKIGQTFEFQYLKNRSFNNYSSVLGKTFCVINIEFAYNGIGKMTIVGKEV